jgi:hypothetical protein
MRTANRNIDYLKAFSELILCDNKISYTGDDLETIVKNFAGDRKSIDAFFDKFTIAFGNHIIRLFKESPRTLDHSVEDLLIDFRDTLYAAIDEQQIDFIERSPF